MVRCPARSLLNRNHLRFYGSLRHFFIPDAEASRWITTWPLLPNPSGLGLFQHTWRLLDGYIWIVSVAVTSGSLISWDFPVICLGDDLFRGKRITGTHLYHVVLWLILIGDTEVVLLIPVTLPPGAQTAHTSATDGHTSSFETLSNKDHGLIESLCSHCSHAVNRHSFQMLCDPLWFIFSFFFSLVWHQSWSKSDYRHQSLSLMTGNGDYPRTQWFHSRNT